MAVYDAAFCSDWSQSHWCLMYIVHRCCQDILKGFLQWNVCYWGHCASRIGLGHEPDSKARKKKKAITDFWQKYQQSDSGTTRLRQDKALPRDARNVLSADRPAFKVIVFAQVCKWWQWLSWWWPGWPSDDTDLSVSNDTIIKEMIFDRKLYLRW